MQQEPSCWLPDDRAPPPKYYEVENSRKQNVLSSLQQAQAKILSTVLATLFIVSPEITPSEERRAASRFLFEGIIHQRKPSLINYNLPFPKFEFLTYLLEDESVLLHGSNHCNLPILEPRQQTDFNGKSIKAVFASGDPIWPMSFATLDQANYRGSIRNGCFVVSTNWKKERRYYFFSINDKMYSQKPWIEGIIYLLPRHKFAQTSQGIVRFDEWASHEPIEPIAALPVLPADFPLYDKVSYHNEDESIYISWLRYKSRLRKAKA